jgi:hypothetical protein
MPRSPAARLPSKNALLAGDAGEVEAAYQALLETSIVSEPDDLSTASAAKLKPAPLGTTIAITPSSDHSRTPGAAPISSHR